MTSEAELEVQRLLDAAEANITKIQWVEGEFAIPVLNEWRYVTRHVVSALFRTQSGEAKEADEEFGKAQNHLKRAYFDSCEILLFCVLGKIRDYLSKYDAYVRDVKDFIPLYSEQRQIALEAQRKCAATNEPDRDKRIENHRVLDGYSDKLVKFLEVLQDNAPACETAIRKRRTNDFIKLAASVCGIVGVFVAVAKAVG
jgi:hypothetical protein